MINLVNMKSINIIKKAQLWLGFFIVFGLVSCNNRSNIININGFTMGTTYSIKIIENDNNNLEAKSIKSKIDSTLQVINMQMSTYINNSEISIFNRRVDNNWQEISDNFYYVVKNANEISNLTNGAFDITVGPLMELWGFRTTNKELWNPPTNEEVLSVKNYIGFNNIEIQDNAIRKLNPNLQIDLNAIAKGYGVDVVFELLQKLGFVDILVEIGGEVRCTGLNQDGKYWSIGIDKPIYDVMPGSDLQDFIFLKNSALATSGDYRNYFYYENKIYSHTINPISGYPVEGGPASVSVMASNCLIADALATALMVMGKEGLSLIESLDNVEALLIQRISENEFKAIKSSGWISN